MGMPHGEALQPWACGNRSPPGELLKRKHSRHLLRMVRKTLFKREVLQRGFAVGEREYNKVKWRFIAKEQGRGRCDGK